MTPEQRNLLVNSFIKSHFSYCPLLWMFCSRTSISKTNKLHELALRLIFNNYNDNFNDLLSLSNDISTHQRCINFFLTEVYKLINGLSPDIMNEVFTIRRNIYNVRTFCIFRSNIPSSNRYGLNSITYRASQLWNILPYDIENSPSISCFKDKIKTLQNIYSKFRLYINVI